MQGNILEETQAFITRQREALLQQGEHIFSQQQELQQQLDEVNAMLTKFDVFEGKRPAPTSTRRTSGTRRGSRREGLLQLVKENPSGLTRGEILEKMGLKGNKSGEMSVSNALTALTKANQVARREGKYVAA